jgi:PAT family beta-lactamase induction signal transducer AmpG
LDKRLWIIFGLGLASGFPWAMIGSAMSAWLAEEGISRSSIGFFGFIFIAYSVNFLWSPFLDRIRLPLLGKWFGQRRAWIITMQLCIALACWFIATIHPATELLYAQGIAFLLALSSATQDIAIDAYRIDSLPEDDSSLMSAGSAMATAGWWTGFAGMGALPLLLVDLDGWNWADVYQLMAFMMLLLILVPLLAREPTTSRQRMQADSSQRYSVLFERNRQLKSGAAASLSGFNRVIENITIWLLVSFVEPLAEFFKRNGVRLALSILLFIFLFKIGEAFLGRMSIVFYKEVGFSNSDIATYSKIISWWVTILFSLIGSLVTIRYGILRGLFIGGLAMASSNLMFALLAIFGANKGILVAAVVIDGFTSAWSTVAFVAFLSMMCNRAFTASQYALMASLGTLGRTLLASYSGVLVDQLDGNWTLFFMLTALMVLPSLLLLYRIRHRIRAMGAEF